MTGYDLSLTTIAQLEHDNISNTKKISFGDSANLDSFSRFRVSTPYTQFENKNTHTHNPTVMKELVSGAGASITYLPNESSVALTIGTASGERIVRQSRHIPYLPGKGKLEILTAVFGVGKPNVSQRVGGFDDDDGLFYEELNGVISIVTRTSTTGSPVDTKIAQSSWNVDKLNGTGESGITLDFTKTQIFLIDYQWLGVGRIRFGFDVDGIIYYCHEIKNANNLDKVYMKTGSLPLRYEIINLGETSNATTLKEICCTSASEGGFETPGLSFGVSNGITTRATSTTKIPILAIRLKNTLNSKENRRTVRFFGASARVSGATHLVELHHIHNPTSITATWVSNGDSSAVEYSTDISAITTTYDHIVKSSYVETGSPGTSSGAASEVSGGIFNEHGLLTQNITSDNSQLFVVYAQTLTGTGTVLASIEWLEFE